VGNERHRAGVTGVEGDGGMKGAVIKAVAEFAEVITGGTPSTTKPEYWDGDVPWLNSGSLNEGVITAPSKFITQLGLANSSAKLMPKDTVLVALTGATTGQVGYLAIEASANQSVTGILPSKEHHPKYLYFFLKSQRQKMLGDAFGGAQPHINQKYVKDFKIPIPPLDDQIRIAHLLGKVEGLIAQRKQHLQQLDDLLKSVFLEMFGDPMRNEKKWEQTTIGELAIDVKYGTSASAQGGQYKYIRMNNITQNGYWDLENLKYIDVDEKELEKYSLMKGDLVFNRTNSKDLVGKTAVYDRDETVVIAGYLIRVRFGNQANPWFVWGHLNSKFGKKRLFNLCRNIVGMANINAQELKAIPILKPPIELQNRFATVVEKVEGIKSHYHQSLTDLEALYGALSQQAFKGVLDLSRVACLPRVQQHL
jgi:type I restriction enzyme S subunit